MIEQEFEITGNGEVKDKETPTVPPVREEVEAGEIVKESNKIYKDKNNKTAVIPVGFAVSEEAGEQVIDDGLVIKDSAGNEFVWIPVTSIDNYERSTNFPTDIFDELKNDTGYLPVEIKEASNGKTLEDLTFEKEKEMVTKKGVEGFYISRYEAGKENTDTLVSKNKASVWAEISQETAKEKAKSFKLEDTTQVKSALISGIQWDMVMSFVNGKKDGMNEDYIVTKASRTPSNRHHSTGVEQAGQNEYDRVCNIYDLEGNCKEFVADKISTSDTMAYVTRGGYYNFESIASSLGDFSSASSCSKNNGDGANLISFRFVLYVM